MVAVVDASKVIEPFGGLFTEIVAGKAYLITYDEDLWKSYDDDGRQFCKDTWIKKATPMADVRFVVLKLVPDDLFPMHGHETPYVEWQHQIDRPPECGFTVDACVTFTVVSDTAKYVDPVTRMEMTKRMQDMRYPAGTHFRIVNGNGDVIERGKL